jgi:hypothetical protein
MHVVLLLPLYADFFMHPLDPHPLYQFVLYRPVLALLVAPAALIITVLVLRRAPGNVNGLFLLLGVALIVSGSLRATSPLRVCDGALNTGWTGIWLLGLYFPNGHTAFPRAERWIHLLCALFILDVVAWGLVQPTFADVSVAAKSTVVPNPLYISALAPLKPLIDGAEMLLLAGVAVLILPSIIVRYRSGDERSRLQIRWLAWAFAIVFVYGLPLFALGYLQADPSTLDPLPKVLLFGFTIYAYLFAFIAVGNAILRHKLYDIDILIRRTVVYGLLTGLLLAVYFGGVVVLQQVFVALTGQRSELAIILSTLAIAALSVPLRNRIQQVIDRRFFRRKYNAQQALESFSRTARDEVDTRQLASGLMDVVQETIQPERMALWVTVPEERR